MTASRPSSAPLNQAQSGMRVTSRTGWSIFGGVALCTLGLINGLNGLYALQRDEYFSGNIIYENLTFWGWAFLIWGALQILAGVLTFADTDAGPALGIGLAMVGCVAWFFFIFSAPAAAIVGIALSIGVMAALATAYAD